MIGKNVKIGVVEMMLKIFHCQESGQKLAIKCATAYLRSRGDKKREEKQIGCQLSSSLTCCCKTAPTAVLDASTMRLMGALG